MPAESRRESASKSRRAGWVKLGVVVASMARMLRGSGPAHGLVTARARGGHDQDAGGRLAVVLDRALRLDVDPNERALWRGDVLVVHDHGRLAADDEEHLLLVALGLVVLRNAAAGRDGDEVDAERLEAEGAAHERPLAVALAVVAVDLCVGGHGAGAPLVVEYRES